MTDEMGATAKAGLGEVRVRVKSASHRCEDIEISCPLASNVRQVKQLIKEQYPLHPEIEEQRIIYAGHLLEDKQILNDVFLPSGQMSSTGGYTLHLACNSTFLRKATKAQNESDAKKSVPPTESSSQQQQQNVPPSMPGGGGRGIPHDILAMHQLYVQQMMNFMAEWQWNHGYPYGMQQAAAWPHQHQPTQMGPRMTMPMPGMNMNPPVPPNMVNMMNQRTPPNMNINPQMPPPNVNMYHAHQVPPTINVNPGVPLNMNPPPAAAPAPQPPVQNPAGEDEPPRDALDWMYTFTRAALILSVVYFYSNLTRFILVLIFTGLVMLFQRRPELLNGLRPNNNNEPAAHPADAPRPANNNPEQGPDGVARDPGAVSVNRSTSTNAESAEAEENSEGAEPSPADELIPEAQPPPVPRHNPLDVTRTFLMTFFTSLIPEIQQN